MRFDVVIIGGGLAGYAAGLRLLEAGKRCALISAGQSALHFSSGSFDFLHSLPDASPVRRPLEALNELARQAPEHPYAILGGERTAALALEAEEALRRWGLAMRGSLAKGNHYRISPLGKAVPTWLSTADSLTADMDGHGPRLPWKRVTLLTVEGFLDCYPDILSLHLEEMGCGVTCRSFSMPALDTLRKNPSEFRSINIARVLERPDSLPLLEARLRDAGKETDAVLLPACIGQNQELLNRLEKAAGVPVRLIATLPPSLLGTRIARRLARVFLDKGGVAMPGDRAVAFSLGVAHDGAPRIEHLYTVNHEDIPLVAETYILATGGFFSGGLYAGQQGVRESLFGLDMTAHPLRRDAWTVDSVFAPQPYAEFGVACDADMRAQLNGKAFANLRVAGMALGGYDPVRLGCGAGVALVSAFAAAQGLLHDGGRA